MKSQEQNKFMKAVNGSRILGVLFRFSDFLYKKLKSGVIGGFFTCYDRIESKFHESGIVCGFDNASGQHDGFASRVRRKLSEEFENSGCLSGASRAINYLLGSSLRTYGLFAFSFGLYTLLVYLIKRFALNLENPDASYLVVGAAMLVVSLFMMPSRKPLAEALKQSAVMSFVLFDVLGIFPDLLDDREAKNGGKGNIAFILGMLAGALTFAVAPVMIPAAILGVVAVFILFHSPETGVLAMIFVLPFLVVLPHPSIALACFLLLTCFSFFIKLIRGKRVLRFETIDYAVVLFAFLVFVGGFISASGNESLKTALIYCCLMLGYFLVVNLIRTPQWLRRCVYALVISASLVSAFGIYQSISGVAELKWIDSSMFKSIGGRVVSTFENPNMLAEYLIMVFPFCAAMLLRGKNVKQKTAAFVACVLLGACLIYTWARGAWLGLIVAMLLFLLIYSKKTLAFVFLGLFTAPFLTFVLPSSVVTRFTSIGNLADSSTSYRMYIWKGALKMFRDFFFSGIGVGETAFTEVYPLYTYSGIEAAPHSHNLYLQTGIELGVFGLIVLLLILILFAQSSFTYLSRTEDKTSRLMCAAGMCGAVAALVQGMTDYIWHNYRVFFIFFVVLALTNAYRRTGTSLAKPKSDPMSSSDSASIEIDVIRDRSA